MGSKDRFSFDMVQLFLLKLDQKINISLARPKAEKTSGIAEEICWLRARYVIDGQDISETNSDISSFDSFEGNKKLKNRRDSD